MVCYLDMLKVVFVDMWFILKKGEFWSGIVKNCCKNGDYYWVWVNVVLMVCEGKISGYMLICIWVMDEEIVVVELLYKVLNVGCISKCIYKGLVVCKGWLGKLFLLLFCWWVCGVMILMFILLVVMFWFVVVLVVMYIFCVLVVLLVSVCFEWQIVCLIENVVYQVLKVVIGECNSVEYLNCSDELGLILCVVG